MGIAVSLASIRSRTVFQISTFNPALLFQCLLMLSYVKKMAKLQKNVQIRKVITDKFDVLRSRLLGNHNDFHWQLGGLATLLQGFSDFFTCFFFFLVPQVKNRLFPRKPLPLCKLLRFVQLGQESCPAGE